MNAQHDHNTPEDRPSGTSDSESGVEIPEWAPIEPLPSSEMVLAAIAGMVQVTATAILDPAGEFVECQRQYRSALAVLNQTSASAEQMKEAAAVLASAKSDVDMLIMVIDESVADRLLQRRKDRLHMRPSAPPADSAPNVVVHTESVGMIAARMAELWERLVAKASDLDELPEAHQLCELCAAYDAFAAEIESGRRLPPGL
ncbi:hypothetical protein [Nocardia sp. CA-119907]|uniref:hypothetical protein n=1 Tax=Nocardia sp. CA-119907 TaxID=3239973 RepID=UPI003D95B62B